MKLLDVNKEKRGVVVYITSLLWLGLAAVSSYLNVPLKDLAVYFISLTGFITTYIWGESVRPAEETSIFLKGKTSVREKTIYLTLILWILLGAFGVYRKLNFVDLAAYFGALTPFVGAFILGRSYKSNIATPIPEFTNNQTSTDIKSDSTVNNTETQTDTPDNTNSSDK